MNILYSWEQLFGIFNCLNCIVIIDNNFKKLRGY